MLTNILIKENTQNGRLLLVGLWYVFIFIGVLYGGPYSQVEVALFNGSRGEECGFNKGKEEVGVRHCGKVLYL